MSVCVTTPTGTQTNVETTQSLQTAFSQGLTTLAASESVFTSHACTLTTNGTCAGTSDVLSTSTIPGATQTISVPVTNTVEVLITSTVTLFGTSCSPSPVTEPDPDSVKSSDQSTPTSPTTSPTTTPSSDSVLTTSSLPPTTITSQSATTLADGQVTVQWITVTSTPPASTYVVPNTPTTATDDNSNSSSNANLGPIIGGVVGGVFGIIGIVLIVWFILKRRRRWDDIFDKEDEQVIAAKGRSRDRFSLSADLEPKPYEYGLVGHVASPNPASPPHSPPMSSNVPLSAESHYASLNARLASRPSTAGSSQPLTGRPPSTGHSHNGSINSPPMQPFSGWPGAVPAAEDPSDFNRSGSPTSFHEPRRLQIVNAPFDRSSVAGSVADDASVVGAVATGVRGSVDGKGRLRTSIAGRDVLVHTDAGRVDEGQGGGASGSGGDPIPPAYSA